MTERTEHNCYIIKRNKSPFYRQGLYLAFFIHSCLSTSMIYFIHIFKLSICFFESSSHFSHAFCDIYSKLILLSRASIRQGGNWWCETKCPEDNSHLKKWFKIQNVWESQHKQIFISSFSSCGAGNNFISSLLLMRECAVKYILQFQQMLPWQ